MKERIFNLFLFVEEGIVRGIGAVAHELDGSDQFKMSFLQANVAKDYQHAKKYPVPSRYVLVAGATQHPGAIRYQSYEELASIGRQIEFFEEVFTDLKAPQDPMMCVTPIIDGKPKIDEVVAF